MFKKIYSFLFNRKKKKTDEELNNILIKHFENHNKKFKHKDMPCSSERVWLNDTHRVDTFYVGGIMNLKVLTHMENGIVLGKTFYDKDGKEIVDEEHIAEISTFAFHNRENVYLT